MVGRYPTDVEYDAFNYMASHRQVPQTVLDNVVKELPSKDMMNKLQTAIAALYAYDDNPTI